MTYRVCKECGRFFEKNGSILCGMCYTRDQKQYEKVRQFVRSHINTTVLEVVNATGVPLRTVLRYIESGMVEYAPSAVFHKKPMEEKDNKKQDHSSGRILRLL